MLYLLLSLLDAFCYHIPKKRKKAKVEIQTQAFWNNSLEKTAMKIFEEKIIDNLSVSSYF